MSMWTVFKSDMNDIAQSIMGNAHYTKRVHPKAIQAGRRPSVESVESIASISSSMSNLSIDRYSLVSDAPSLESDYSDIFSNSPTSNFNDYRKRSRRNRIVASACNDAHPLRDMTATPINELEIEIEPNYGAEIELQTFDTKITRAERPRPLFCRRDNSDFLRMLLAKRNMYMQGKLNFIRCPNTKPAKIDLSTEQLNCMSLFNVPSNRAVRRAPRKWESLTVDDLRD